MWSRFFARKDCRFIGLNGIDFDSRIILFQSMRNTRNSTTSTNTCDKSIQTIFSKGINDFLSCCSFMYLWVSRVFKLKRKEAIPFCSDCFSFSDSAFHSFTSRSQNEFSSIGLDDFTTFHTHGFRHDNHNFVAFSCANP